MKPAIFLDRDGVINEDLGYVIKIDDFNFIDNVFKACCELKKMGYKLVVITNQSGIARGMFSEDEFLALTEWMDWNFVDKGVELDGIYYCPHHPEGKIEKYAIKCSCRKPEPGLILDAAKELDIDLKNSVFIGDKKSDIDAAKKAGISLRFLVKTGKGIEEQGDATTILNSIADLPLHLKKLNLDRLI